MNISILNQLNLLISKLNADIFDILSLINQNNYIVPYENVYIMISRIIIQNF